MITGDDKECEFALPNGCCASMQCLDGDSFSLSTRFAVYSGGYSTESEALEYAQKLKDAVLCFGAKFRLGVDVGKNKASGFLAGHVKEKIFDEQGVRIIEDIHGISAYSEEYPVACFSISAASLVSPRGAKYLMDEVFTILSSEHYLDAQIKLSMELLTSSFFESSPRARFLTLVLSAEAILAPDHRSLKVKKLIDELKSHAKSSDITQQEKDSILGSLNYLYRDSISQSLRKMAATHLTYNVYDGLASEQFIKKCYDARSKLVHTGSVDASKYNIDTLAANLEVYMKDLLTNISGI
tara:strand:- start:14235 stop:15125 length:891 start_codon:yes stop_codon:yes gene_type:complete